MICVDNHQPRKRFGQNFLSDQTVIQQIVAAFNPLPDDQVVEIGPGLGALTVPLLKAAKKIQAIELDKNLIPKIANQCADVGQIKLHQGDALKFDFTTLASTPIRLIGNLPYNISTPLIFHLLKQMPAIADMHFMLQKEVVERICASPGNKSYGRLSIMVQYHCITRQLFTIAPEAFIPPPKVQSAFLRLIPHKNIPYPANDYQRFADLVRTAFNQRRKTLRNSLKEWVDEGTLKKLNIDGQKRPEQLTIEDFVAISNALCD